MSTLHVFILLAVILWGIGVVMVLLENAVSKWPTVFLFLGLIAWALGVLLS